ncbi:MAG: LPS export ABC transporter permease LptG [Gammaproteobacteria bacterium]|nr:MAG: LPS export ABC transporter permease LptG [Gammaproteobacteria bacterium]
MATTGNGVKQLDSYIGRTVLAATVLTWLVVIVLESLFVFLGEIGTIGRGDYTLVDALLFVLLTLPVRAYQSFPMAALIGSLLGLGSLAAQFELNAFRLAGCSPARLTRSVLQAGVLMLLAVVVLGEGWAPSSLQLARQLRASAIFDQVSVQRDAGFWVRSGQRMIQVRRSEADGGLSGLVVYDIDSTPRLVSASRVARAHFQQGQWHLEDIQGSYFSDRQIDVRRSPQSVWPSLIEPRLAQLLTRDSQTLSLPELSQYIDYLQQNGTNVALYRLNYWQRWATPVAVIAMLFLAVGFVLGPVGSLSMGQRVLIGVAVGLVFKLFNEITAHAGLVYGVPPWLSAFAPSALVLIAGLLLLRRTG